MLFIHAPPQRTWPNEEAPSNMLLMSVTLATFQPERSLLNEEA